MGDEHTVIPVFFTGIVFQAFLVSRSMQGAIGASIITALSLGAAWYFTRDDADQILSLPLLAVVIFVILFALFYREYLLPEITGATLLHYTFLGIYAIYAWSDTTPPPGWVAVFVALPVSLALYFGLAPRSPGRFLQLVAYVCFLILLTVLIGGQLSLDGLKAVYESEGFSLGLNAYIFTSGMVFLVFASNVLYLFMLLPLHGRSVWDVVLGSAEEAAREHRDALRNKMSSRRISALAAALLLAHAGALVANYRWEIVDPAMWMNTAVVAIGMLSPLTDGGEDDETPARMLASGQQAHHA